MINASGSLCGLPAGRDALVGYSMKTPKLVQIQTLERKVHAVLYSN